MDSGFRQQLHAEMMQQLQQPQGFSLSGFFAANAKALIGLSLATVVTISGLSMMVIDQNTATIPNQVANPGATTTVSPPDSFAIGTPQPQKCELITYTSPQLPGASFEYNECLWELDVQNKAERIWDLKLKNIETQGILTAHIDASIRTLDSVSACSDKQYTDLASDLGRITIGKNKFAYYSSTFPRGSQTFTDIVAAHQEWDGTKSVPLYSGSENFCYYPDIPFSTDTDRISNGVGVEAGRPYPALIQITFSGEGVKAADTVVESINLISQPPAPPTPPTTGTNPPPFSSSSSQSACTNKPIIYAGTFKGVQLSYDSCEWTEKRNKKNVENSTDFTLHIYLYQYQGRHIDPYRLQRHQGV